MQRGKLRAPQHLMPEFASTLHDGAQHLVVAAAREQDLARVQLVQRAGDGPHVDGEVVGDAEDCNGQRAGLGQPVWARARLTH